MKTPPTFAHISIALYGNIAYPQKNDVVVRNWTKN